MNKILDSNCELLAVAKIGEFRSPKRFPAGFLFEFLRIRVWLLT
jgi:hypothetical protein